MGSFLLDLAIAAANSSEDSTGSLDLTMVKAVFLRSVLRRGRTDSTGKPVGLLTASIRAGADVRSIEDEIIETITRDETYTAILPLSLSDAYTNLSAEGS